MQRKILRSMVKELAQLDLPFFSYDQITVNLATFKKMAKIDSYLALAKRRLVQLSFTIGHKILFCMSGCIKKPKIQRF